MPLDEFPLSMFVVDCDGTACASGKDVGLHEHPVQYPDCPPLARVIYRDGQRVRYEEVV